MRLIILLSFLYLSANLFAQLERKVENENAVEELTFHAPRHINLFTVEPLSKGELHWSIMHTFGTIDNGFRNLWGIDNGANIRISFEYGISDKFSAGFGRSSLDQVYDFSARYHLLQQTISNSMPLSVSITLNTAINSADYGFLGDSKPVFSDRVSHTAQLMLARKFGDKFSFQLSPMLVYFQNMQGIYLVDGTQDVYAALGLSAKYKLTGKTSLTAQYIPNLNSSLNNNIAFGLDFEAGGHVFQMYLASGAALNEQYLLASNNGQFWEGIRFGFNVNRIFSLGQK